MQIVNKDSSSGIISQFDYEYGPTGEIKKWTRQAGTNPSKAMAFIYDKAYQLTSAVDKVVSTGQIEDTYQYRYDAAGNRRIAQTNGDPVAGTFNDLNQLTDLDSGGATVFQGSVSEPALVTVGGQATRMYDDGDDTNDPGGPMIFEKELSLTTGTHQIAITADDGTNPPVTDTYEVTIAGGVSETLSYDADGNLLSDGTRSYTWDKLNRLLSIDYLGTTLRTEFVYDGFGRRIKIIEKDNGVVTESNCFLWDGNMIAEKRDSTGATTLRRYFDHGFQIEGGISDQEYFYTKDHLGSIREVIADDGITLESRYDYLPWGEVTKVSGMGAESDFLYTGHLLHEGSGLYLTEYRLYDAYTGRWLSKEPLGEAASLNLYAYVWSNPINAIDPDGLNGIWSSMNSSTGFAVMRALGKQAGTYAVSKAANAAVNYAINNFVPCQYQNAARQAYSVMQKIQGLISFGRMARAGFGVSGKLYASGGSHHRILNATARQLQKKFQKHAKVLGVKGNYNKVNAAKFHSAINNHINSPSVKVIPGTLRKNTPAVHYLDPKTRINVVSDPSGNFISVWKLSAQSVKHVLETGSLGGG